MRAEPRAACGTDYIDLYQIHRPDPTVEVEETLSGADRSPARGKGARIGSSTFPAEEIVEAQWVAERRGYERFPAVSSRRIRPGRGIERVGAAHVYAIRHGRDRLEPAQRRLARRASTSAARTTPRARVRRGVRWIRPRRRTTSASSTRSSSSRRSRPMPAPHSRISRSPVERGASGRDLDDHRPEDEGAARRAPGAAQVTLDVDTLDRIDEIVPPGRTLHVPDNGYDPPESRGVGPTPPARLTATRQITAAQSRKRPSDGTPTTRTYRTAVSELCLGTMNFGRHDQRRVRDRWTMRSTRESTSSTRPTATAGTKGPGATERDHRALVRPGRRAA